MPLVVEVENMLFQQLWDIYRLLKIEVEIQFLLHPAIERLNNWVICWSSPSRHGAKYVILVMGLAKSLGRVDSSLVGVEDYLGLLLFLFSCQSVKDGKTVIVWFAAAGNICDAVRKDLVIEGI